MSADTYDRNVALLWYLYEHRGHELGTRFRTFKKRPKYMAGTGPITYFTLLCQTCHLEIGWDIDAKPERPPWMATTEELLAAAQRDAGVKA